MENKLNPVLKKTLIISVLILFILLCFVGYNFYQDTIRKLQEEISDYKKMYAEKVLAISEYREQINSYETQINFMNNFVVICPLDGSGLYHKYNCEHLDKHSSFMIFNINQAPNEGYSPCYHCNNTVIDKDTQSEIVYITDTGSKYHKEWCSYLKSKKAITLDNAQNQGYSPCSRCNP